MKIAIIYYSYTGTTKKYVEKIKSYINLEKNSVELIEIKPKADIKVKGFTSYIVGGLKTFKKEAPELKEYSFNRDDYDFIIFASPVWAYTYAPSLRTFFETEKITDKKVSYLYTHRGTPAKTALKFEEVLAENKIISGLGINAKNKEDENFKELKMWIENILK